MSTLAENNSLVTTMQVTELTGGISQTSTQKLLLTTQSSHLTTPQSTGITE